MPPTDDSPVRVEVETEDTLPALRSRLELAEGSSVQVVIPSGHPAFRSELGVSYLSRHAELLGKKLVIVSSDSGVRRAARAHGIPLVAAERRPTARSDVKHERAAESPAPFSAWWLIVVLAVAALVIWAGTAIVPGATVVVRPSSQLLSETTTVTATLDASGVDPAAATLPARRVEARVEVSGRVAATGSKLKPQTPASGQVVFVNRSGETVVVPGGTRLATASGVEFATIGNLMLPPAPQSVAIASVVAAEPGKSGNVEAGTITRILNTALAAKLWVVNEVPTSGGSDTEQRTVSADDRRLLEQQLLDTARQGGLPTLMASAGANSHVYPQTVTAQLVSLEAGQVEGDAAEALTGKGIVSLRALAVDQPSVDELVRRRMAPDDPGQLVAGTLRTEYQDLLRTSDDGFSFRLFGQARILPAVDVETLRNGLAGKSVAEAEAYLRVRLGLAEPPEIELSPLWVRQLPRFAWRITVSVLPGG